jgi:hypothetical protein
MQQPWRWHSSELTCLTKPFPEWSGHGASCSPHAPSPISPAQGGRSPSRRRVRLSCRGRNRLCTPQPKNAVRSAKWKLRCRQSGFETRTEEDRSEEESYKLTSSGSQTSGARSFPKGGGDVSVQLQTQGFRAGESEMRSAPTLQPGTRGTRRHQGWMLDLLLSL